jgi:hypothetical protein
LRLGGPVSELRIGMELHALRQERVRTTAAAAAGVGDVVDSDSISVR